MPCAAPQPLAAQDAAEGWTPELAMRYRAVGPTALAPDGAHLASVVREPLMEGPQSEYLSHVWMAQSDGEDAGMW